MKRHYLNRLLKLAAFLEKLPPKRFNFTKWVGDDWGGAQDLSCGTTACALGWAATMPEFRRLGMRLCGNGEVRLLKNGQDQGGPWMIGLDVFGLDSTQFSDLFTPGIGRLGDNATAKQVAKNIRKFVKENET